MPVDGCGVQGLSGKVGGSLGMEVLGEDGVKRDVGVFVDALLQLLVPGLPQVSEHHWLLCWARLRGPLPGPPSCPQESCSF